MKNYIAITLVCALTLLYAINSRLVFAQSIKLPSISQQSPNNLTSQPKFGDRPPIDLKNVSKNTYHPGIIMIKFCPEAVKDFDHVNLSNTKEGYIKTGIAELDQLNKAYNINEYIPLLDNIYELSPITAKYKERHEAWGFHLWYELKTYYKTDIIEAAKSYSNLPLVSKAEPVYKIKLIEPITINDYNSRSENIYKTFPNDPFFSDYQWSLNNTGQEINQAGTPGWDINIEPAWEIEKGDSNVVVAVLDQGVDHEHEDLKDNIWPGVGPGGKETKPGRHGIHVAGIIAAVTNNNTGIAGIAGGRGDGDGTSIMSINIFDGSISILESFIYAADNGAAISQNSWGYDSAGIYNTPVLDGIDYFNTYGGGNELLEGGITIFSAGNENDSGYWYPGYYGFDDPNTLGAMSVSSHDNRGYKSGFSNYGQWIDITAPGSYIMSTDSVKENGDPPYSFMSGTSMASPHVAGVAALIIANNSGNITNTHLWDVLVSSANTALYDKNPNFTGLLGKGALDALAALEMAKQQLSVPNPLKFTATTLSKTEIMLDWEHNKFGHDVLIAWTNFEEPFGNPVNGETYKAGDNIPGGGEVIYAGNGKNYLHDKLTPGTGYTYKIWSIASRDTAEFNKGDYSYGFTVNGFTNCLIITELPFLENFDNDHHIIKHCWKIKDSLEYDQTWDFGEISNGLENSEGSYAYVNSKRFGPDGSQNTSLITPTMDLSDYQKVTLEFKHFFKQWKDVSLATLSYSTNNGESWQIIKTWKSSTPNPSVFRRVLEGVGGNDKVMFKWNYKGQWGFYWCIDNVKISESTSQHYADYSISRLNVAVGDTVTFMDNSHNSQFGSWKWEFGEGAKPATIDGKGPHIVKFIKPGLKSPKMTADNNHVITKENYLNVFEINDKLHWDNNINSNAIGLSDEGIWQSAIRFKKADLVYYDNYIITEISVFIGNLPEKAIIKIWEKDLKGNLYEKISQTFKADSNSWNNIKLRNPHRINADKKLLIGVEYHDQGDGVFPAGIDNSTKHDRKGNLLRSNIEDNNKWLPLSLYNIDGNWNIQATILYDENKYIVSAVSNLPEAVIIRGTGLYNKYSEAFVDILPLRRYNFINWTKNGSVVHDQVQYNFTVYEDTYLVANIAPLTSVDNLIDEKLSIYPNPARRFVNIKSKVPVLKIEINDLSGNTVHQQNVDSKHVTINTSTLTSGLYILQIYTPNSVYKHKLQVL